MSKLFFNQALVIHLEVVVVVNLKGEKMESSARSRRGTSLDGHFALRQTIAKSSRVGGFLAVFLMESASLISVVLPPSIERFDDSDFLILRTAKFQFVLQRLQHSLQFLMRRFVYSVQLRTVGGDDLRSTRDGATVVAYLHVVVTIVPCAALFVDAQNGSERVSDDGNADGDVAIRLAVTIRDGDVHRVFRTIAIHV